MIGRDHLIWRNGLRDKIIDIFLGRNRNLRRVEEKTDALVSWQKSFIATCAGIQIGDRRDGIFRDGLVVCGILSPLHALNGGSCFHHFTQARIVPPGDVAVESLLYKS